MRRKINAGEAVDMYTKSHLTCKQIGKVFGVSKVAVWKGEQVTVACYQCGEVCQGRRWARHVASRFITLEPYMVVHHWDADTHHNHPCNLAVFRSQAEYVRFGQEGRGRPVWDGRQLTDEQLVARGYNR